MRYKEQFSSGGGLSTKQVVSRGQEFFTRKQHFASGGSLKSFLVFSEKNKYDVPAYEDCFKQHVRGVGGV